MAASRRKAAAFSWAVESLLLDLWGGEAEIAKACGCWGLHGADGCCRYNNVARQLWRRKNRSKQERAILGTREIPILEQEILETKPRKEATS